jgi:hypothetical protein
VPSICYALSNLTTGGITLVNIEGLQDRQARHTFAPTYSRSTSFIQECDSSDSLRLFFLAVSVSLMNRGNFSGALGDVGPCACKMPFKHSFSSRQGVLLLLGQTFPKRRLSPVPGIASSRSSPFEQRRFNTTLVVGSVTLRH